MGWVIPYCATVQISAEIGNIVIGCRVTMIPVVVAIVIWALVTTIWATKPFGCSSSLGRCCYSTLFLYTVC